MITHRYAMAGILLAIVAAVCVIIFWWNIQNFAFYISHGNDAINIKYYDKYGKLAEKAAARDLGKKFPSGSALTAFAQIMQASGAQCHLINDEQTHGKTYFCDYMYQERSVRALFVTVRWQIFAELDETNTRIRRIGVARGLIAL